MVISKTVAEKTATKPIQQNGEQLKKETSAVKLPTIEPEKRPDVKLEIKKSLPTIEARLQKLEDLQKLVERRETLKDAIDNLGGFYIAPSGNCNLRLQDSTGKTFAIAHPSVIGEMVDMAKARLNSELSKIESQITFDL